MVLKSAKIRMYHQSEVFLTANERLECSATESIMIPEKKNLIPANSILLPVISGVMPNSANPSFMKGYAHPQRIAAVSANIETQTGR